MSDTYGTIHVQSDNRMSIDHAISEFLPRLEGPDVESVANGWIRITDPLLDRDREAQSKLAREISERLGGVVVALALEGGAVVRFRLFDKGLMVDEYLSVPTYYGEVAKVDELTLSANPTLVARLTGADRDEVKRVARTGATAGDLRPATEL
jgi:hypothetical protein